MITLKKDDGVKVVSPESALIPLLKKQGWVVEGEEAEAPKRGRPAKEKAE